MSAKRVKNILTGDWVIVSPDGRLNRPWKGRMDNRDVEELERKRHDDPLAPGGTRNGGVKTPLYAYTYLFANDFPVFDKPSDKNDWSGDEINEDDLLYSKPCEGESHVMTYSPDFYKHFAQMNALELTQVFDGWLNFFQANQHRFDYIQIFENRGAEIGSSLPHPHCQIWSTRFLPTTVEKMYNNQMAYYKAKGSVMLLDYLKKELAIGSRIVAELDHFVVLVPFWAYWPYEVMILPKRQLYRITDFTEAEKLDFMKALQMVAGKYDTFFDCPAPYVLAIRNAPVGHYLTEDVSFWQLHVNICPPLLVKGRLKFMAGFELLDEVQRDFKGEIAAERLRNVNYIPPK